MKSLILGGVKSGKSRYAENYVKQFLHANALHDKDVSFIATADALDEPMAQRIEQHKLQRPNNWKVIEEPLDLANALIAAEQTSKIILIDCLTLWLTNLLMQDDPELLVSSLDAFLQALSQSTCELVMVSNETNMGIMPLGQLTRDYCDRAGIMHQALAEVCDTVLLIVAGLPLSLKSPMASD